MKKEGKLKKFVLCTTYLILALICLLSTIFLIYKTSNKENDNIVRASENANYLRNVNPRFLVDFVNEQYVRFETVSTYSNPFEGKEPSILEKIKYTLGIRQERKGIQISLVDVSYDTELKNIIDEKDINISEYSLNRNFELVTTGREIGKEGKDAVSKDTVVSRNIYKGVDIEYQIIEGKGLKEEIILREIPEYVTDCLEGECILPVNSFLFKLELDEGLEIRRSINGNEQYPSGVLYISDKEGNYFAHFLPEFAVDSVGFKTNNVVSNISSIGDGVYMFEVILDSQWLLSEERVFPIRIDPSIVHDNEMAFNQGIFDRVSMDSSLMITLDSKEQKSGTFTSPILDLGSTTQLNGINWQGFAKATGDGESSFSTLGLIHQEYFNDLTSSKKRWGSGALQLNSFSDSKVLNINSSSSNFFTYELWSHVRYIDNEQYIFSSNLANLKSKDGKYVLEDSTGVEYITQIPVKYNSWQYIALVYDIVGSTVNIYVDELDDSKDFQYGGQSSIDTITFTNSVGYIDTVRIYDRLVARNELLANSQYSKLYLQYTGSLDGFSWDDWNTKGKYTPDIAVNDGYLEIGSNNGEDLSSYEILSLEFLSDKDEKLVLGSSSFVNGILDADTILLEENEGLLEGVEGVKYVDLLFTPSSVDNSCILALDGLEVYTLDTGKVGVKVGDEILSLNDKYILNVVNHIAISLTDTKSLIFLNGNLLESNTAYTISPTQYSIKSGCEEITSTTEINVDNVRISTVSKSNSDVLDYNDIGSREYTLKPVFKAQLQSDTGISDINDTQFSITEKPYGSSNFISNLNIGDSIVISQGNYIVEGVVTYLDNDTGQVVVDGWKEGGSVPELGFSTEALVIKWQTEYVSTKDISFTNFLNMKSNVISNIRNIYMFSAINSYNNEAFGSNSYRYIKYKFIYMTSKYGLTSYLSNVNIEYALSGPSMDKIMRHGKWFDEGVKQDFWWSK